MLLYVIILVSAVLSVLGYFTGVYETFFMIPIMLISTTVVLMLLWVFICFICTRFIRMDREYDKSSKVYWWYTERIIELVMQILRIQLKVTGKEVLSEEKFLLVCNHKAALDPLLTMGVLREYDMGFVAKQEIFKIPIIARLMHRCHCLCLKRGDMKESAKTILKASELIKKDKASIGIYPEGTRNPKDKMLPFMNGAFKIAKKANCPVVVATIRNTEKIIRRAPFRKTVIYLDFIGILDKEFVAKNNTVEISNAARNMMEQAL